MEFNSRISTLTTAMDEQDGGMSEIILRTSEALAILNNSLPTLSNQEIISRLQQALDDNNTLRPMQRDAYAAIIGHLANDEYTWLVKKPTGAGKTMLFGAFIRDLGLPALILVPRVNLVSGTRDELTGSIEENKRWLWVDRENVFTIDSDDKKQKGSSSQKLQTILSDIVENKIVQPVIIMTYPALISIHKKNPQLVNLLFRYIWVVVSDEGHRSLWSITSRSQPQQTDKNLFPEVSTLIEWANRIHLVFTATPRMTQKDVRQHYPVIYSATFIDSVNAWDIILPSREVIDPLMQVADGRIYTNALGVPSDSLFIDAYKKLKNKQPREYFPGVFFCRDIHHAEEVRDALIKKWIRAERVTSGTHDTHFGYKTISPQEASRGLTDGDIDVITTVIKVSEWWDVPTLRCAVPMTPIISPAKLVQWIGRIARTLSDELSHLGPKDSSNTIIIEPRAWLSAGGNPNFSKIYFDAPPEIYTIEGLHENFPEFDSPEFTKLISHDIKKWEPEWWDMSPVDSEPTPTGIPWVKKSARGLYRIPTALEIMYLTGEIDEESMRTAYPDINISNLPRHELNADGEIEIEGQQYIYLGKGTMRGFPETLLTIKKLLALAPESWKQENMIPFGWTVRGNFVDIYKKDALMQHLSGRYSEDIKLDNADQNIVKYKDDYWYIRNDNLPISMSLFSKYLNTIPEEDRNKYILHDIAIQRSPGSRPLWMSKKLRTKGNLINVLGLWKLIADNSPNFSISKKLHFQNNDAQWSNWSNATKIAIIFKKDKRSEFYGLTELLADGDVRKFIKYIEYVTGSKMDSSVPLNSKTGKRYTNGRWYAKNQFDTLFLKMIRELTCDV